MKDKKADTSGTKYFNIFFIVIFFLMLVVPAVCINTKPLQISEIDNELLTEWPGLAFTEENVEELENYADDRIGFREQLVTLYITLNDRLFHVMTHPLFMYGEEGHIYYKDPSYITAFQRMNTNEEWLDGFVDFLEKTNAYLKSRGIDFLYYLCPDKKTIYPEYFPKSVNVNYENKTVPEYIEEQLKKGVDGAVDVSEDPGYEGPAVSYIIPIPQLTEAKKDQIVYNKLYDATHWNEDGAFIGHELIDNWIRERKEDVPKLKREDFTREMDLKESLDIAKFPIHEEVPRYVPKSDTSSNFTDYLLPVIECYTPTFYAHFTNPDCGNNRILLIFTDSYFATYLKFYQNRFSEVYFVHRQNYEYLQYYINLLFPDTVIFETAERSISGEMMEQTDFNDTVYEPPYTEAMAPTKEAVGQGSGLRYILSEINGVTLEKTEEGKVLWLDVSEGDSIVSLNGFLFPEEGRSAQDYDIYARIGDAAVVETDYLALHRKNGLWTEAPSEEERPTYTENPAEKAFSVNVQRRYLQEMQIELFAVDTKDNVSYLLDTFNVKYQ
ncbi:MAG: hypothetical protein IJT16_10385 [Lachnospiraceae bacterium]|nr:hypothetical protein [Lachnospiraceae bacterium]